MNINNYFHPANPISPLHPTNPVSPLYPEVQEKQSEHSNINKNIGITENIIFCGVIIFFILIMTIIHLKFRELGEDCQ